MAAPFLIGGAAALALLAPFQRRPRLVWNATASVPIGLYSVSPATRIGAGDLVIARPPAAVTALAAQRRYLPAGVPLVKRVTALPGDRVCAVGDRLFTPHGPVAHRLRHDGAGRWLPWWSGCGRLAAGRYLLMSDVPGSFDGRYFGPSDRSEIIGKARPLWLR